MGDMHQEHVLATRLRACGHFLYYQTGGKAGQRRILVTLLRRGGLTQKELQDELELSSGALSEILQKMEDVALVERTKSCDDKRQIELASFPPHSDQGPLQPHAQADVRLPECGGKDAAGRNFGKAGGTPRFA